MAASISLIFLILLSFPILSWVSKSVDSLPHLFVHPQSATIPELGGIVTVEVVVHNVTDCYGVDFWLTYNSTFLSKLGLVDVHGPFDSGNPPIRPDPVTYPGGYVLTDISLPGTVRVSLTFVGALGAPSFNGTGTVCAITFQGDALGVSNLTFDESKVKIWDPTGTGQPRDPSVNGEITVPPPPLPAISLNPSEYTSPAPGESFIIDINITNVTDLQHYEFKLWFNNTLLNATGVAPGPANPLGTSFIPGKMVGDPPVYEWTPLQNVSNGFVWTGASLPVGQVFTGSETLMTISFTSLTGGNCTLHLNETVLANSMEVEIDHLTLDGFVTVTSKIGDYHTDHLNDPTDDFPNDYTPMIIPFYTRNVIIAPFINCTILENDVFKHYHHPCKSAQTLFVDDDWEDNDANYTYIFEDWTDYDWNDIVVSLRARANSLMINAETCLESREAVWKNPFGVEITPVGMDVELHWNSTDYPQEHILELSLGETVKIELFAESNPCDTALMTINPLISPTASFVYSPLEPEEGQIATFDASDSTQNIGTLISYYWNFGDGEFGTGKIVSHAYETAGNYMVTLNVTNIVGGWDIESKQITVKPKPQPVGGRALPINIELGKSSSLTPQIGLALSLTSVMAITIILIKCRKKKQKT